MKKIITLILAVCLVLAMVPAVEYLFAVVFQLPTFL